MFQPVESNVRFPLLEERVLAFWRQRRIYEKSLENRAGAEKFVFFEGPPTANGMPHPGHCLTRAIKDLFPRYQTMRGKLCERKAGWDTHGLPVEVEVCKELGIHSKEEIEAYGVERFIHKCQASVWRYMQQWEKLTERLGFWVDLKDAYVTYHQSYVESVWWSLKNLFDRGLLYQGHKIVWWWAQGGTALSAGEVGQGYREVADPSVYVRFPLVDAPLGLDGADLLIWTTTPWTLPSNQFAAVHPDLDYAIVKEDGNVRRLIIAESLVESLSNKAKTALSIERVVKGDSLLHLRYQPPFDYYYSGHPNRNDSTSIRPPWGEMTAELAKGGFDHIGWRIVAADFVTTDSGTGVVHIAPAFGEADFDLLLREKRRFKHQLWPELIACVGSDGKFEANTDFAGMWVKDADKPICRMLRDRGLLYHQEQYLHEYPFCWRAEEDPLIQYPRKSWFVKTSQFKDAMLENNSRINWLPEHIKDGRFGNFLATNVDWALSRERYWGTPLPIWVCEETGKMEAIASYDELLAKPGVAGLDAWENAKREHPGLSEDLKIHKPYIDEVTYDSPHAQGKRMRRVNDVIDCWYDSGAMPFAQWGYPHTEGSKEHFSEQFPADFISEAIDQTRGWFYSQLAISTLVHEDRPYPHPFRNCIVLGLMLGEDGQKMSKSKRNYREPNEIFDKYGADALRWYFFANQPPWTTIRYSEQAIKDSIPEFLLRLWHTYSFFVIYANIDGFDPAANRPGNAGDLDRDSLEKATGYTKLNKRSELDRWILGELDLTAAAVVKSMDAYDNFEACKRITGFVDALSNWYVRRSRNRFWSNEPDSPAKSDAYWTLYECLVTTCKLVAPFTPFVAEAMWQNLVSSTFGDRAAESVHLCDYPAGSEQEAVTGLSRRVALMRSIVSLGRAARMEAKLKVRQPLSKVEIVVLEASDANWLQSHAAMIAEELNVKEVELVAAANEYVNYTVLPDLKRLGPKLGKRLPELKKWLAATDAAKLLAEMSGQGSVTVPLADGPLTLDPLDLQVRMQAKPGWAAAHDASGVVVLSTEITPDLVEEGSARELVHALQSTRKDMGCEYTDRIAVSVVSQSPEIQAAVKRFGEYIASETLALPIGDKPVPFAASVDVKVNGHDVKLYVARASMPLYIKGVE